ncbi:hypothetical protein G6F31_012277 [Rhizopus arrhizus]|nr:hypothetical protein G6F31_012277 [Rhizopus arrhizus]
MPPARPLLVHHIAQPGQAGQQGGGEQGVVLPAHEQPGAEDATGEEAADDQPAEGQSANLQRQPTQQVSEADAEVGEHAAEVGGAHHCAAEGGGHRILQAAGHGGGQCAPDLVLFEQRNGHQQQRRFQRQRNAVTTPQLQGAVLDQQAAEHGAQREGDQQAPQMPDRTPVALGQRHAQLAGAAGHVADRLVLETQKSDHVDHAGPARERNRTDPDPGGQAYSHRQGPSGPAEAAVELQLAEGVAGRVEHGAPELCTAIADADRFTGRIDAAVVGQVEGVDVDQPLAGTFDADVLAIEVQHLRHLRLQRGQLRFQLVDLLPAGRPVATDPPRHAAGAGSRAGV